MAFINWKRRQVFVLIKYSDWFQSIADLTADGLNVCAGSRYYFFFFSLKFVLQADDYFFAESVAVNGGGGDRKNQTTPNSH